MNAVAVAVVPFSFEGAQVRVITRDGAPWFILSDAARVLGIANSRDAATRLDDDERDGVGITDTIGREQLTAVVSESGLYALAMTSRKPAARRFRKWVTAEVVPSIRQTGGYGMPAAPIALNDAASLRHALLDYTEQVLALQAQNAELVPKAVALDRIAAGAVDGSLCLTDAAKVLKVQRKALIAFLAAGWIYRRAGTDHWIGYQAKVAAGLVEHRVRTITRPDGGERLVEQVLITPKGLAKLAEILPPPANPPIRGSIIGITA